MPAIVLEGKERVPVRYDDWGAWREELTAPDAAAPLVVPGTRSCTLCWGAGRILHQARNGEGLVPAPCEACGGSGLVVA